MVKQDDDVQNEGCVHASIWVGQKISAQRTYLGVFIVNSNENSSNIGVLLLH